MNRDHVAFLSRLLVEILYMFLKKKKNIYCTYLRDALSYDYNFHNLPYFYVWDELS